MHQTTSRGAKVGYFYFSFTYFYAGKAYSRLFEEQVSLNGARA